MVNALMGLISRLALLLSEDGRCKEQGGEADKHFNYHALKYTHHHQNGERNSNSSE